MTGIVYFHKNFYMEGEPIRRMLACIENTERDYYPLERAVLRDLFLNHPELYYFTTGLPYPEDLYDIDDDSDRMNAFLASLKQTQSALSSSSAPQPS